ncbi:Uncharacterized protein TPAR_08010 [Tolypocladium paradoxum]|uniref:Uncharacterized protein n=1 Tax=Tolypocladium paradoxum TaxID=94208 RepID=A0A2S4KNJ3_9HYPO|nr:Uncharacterized protein TPAR_08010 [Tolypocladium paradoxum]
MWDRLRTPSSGTTTTITTTTTTTGQRPRVPWTRSGAGLHKQRLARNRAAQQLDDPLDALGISHAPYKCEIRKGKVVPQVAHVDISLPSHQHAILAAAVRGPPPRNPRRRTKQQPHQRLQSDSGWRPASSVYDQSDGNSSDSDDAVKTQPRLASSDMSAHAAEAQVSPPSSPDTGGFRDGRMAEDVSPIDDELDLAQQVMLRGSRPEPQPAAYQEDHRSNLPTMRSDHRGPRGAGTPVAPQLRGHMPDDVPRERQVHLGQRPATQAHEMRRNPASGSEASRLAPDNAPAFGSTVTIMGPLPGGRNTPSPSFGQRMRMMGRSRPEPVDSRPPWHGASGRSKLVQPVRDVINVAPLNIPRKSSKRTGRGESEGPPSILRPSGPETSNAGVASRRPLPLTSNQKASRKAAMVSSPPSRPPLHPGAGAQVYPSPPDSDFLAPSPPPAAARSTGHSPTTSSPYPDALPTSSGKAIKRKPPPSANPSSTTPARASVTSSLAQSHPAPDSTSPQQSTPQDAWAQPASRFSVTTYATSNPATPRQSADESRPQVPPLPALQTSVMDRRRPFSGASGGKASEEPTVISMSSTYSTVDKEKLSAHRPTEHVSHARVASNANSAERRSSILSMAKPLPPAPHELSSSQDRVAHLNAQIHGLVHRRFNINKSIQQMTELMPTDNLMASSQVLRKREAEKQKVEALKEELAQVQREEYDLGLKLHRAYKRLDKDAEFEPTTLWVRRVTS